MKAFTSSILITLFMAVPVLAEPQVPSVIVIDNDEGAEQQTTLKSEPLPTNENATAVKIGAHFPVVLTSQISSKTARAGDSIEALLKDDLKIGDRLVAQKGSRVHGHIDYAL